MTEIVFIAPHGARQHALPLLERLGARAVIEQDWLPERVFAHDPKLIVVFDEHGAELGNLVAEAKLRGVATLQIMDGILEWRRTWEYPTSMEKRPLNQPALSDRIACLGPLDARLLQRWGNVENCVVIGVPRFDRLTSARRPPRIALIAGRKTRVLVLTAKTAAFNSRQLDLVVASLHDLKAAFAEREEFEVLWRLTGDLASQIGVSNTTTNVLSGQLHEVLSEVDAVITTPSTAMLEAMLFGHPVAIIDYTNSPNYVPAAWRISAKAHIQDVLSSLACPSPARMTYQEHVLEDALDTRPEAVNRMLELIDCMVGVCEPGQPRADSVMPSPNGIPAPRPFALDMHALYPAHEVFAITNVARLQAELEAARGTNTILARRLLAAEARLQSIPGYRTLRRLRNYLKLRSK